MYGNYQYLSQLRDQARNYTNEGDGQKLFELNDDKNLIPFEASGGVLSLIGWGSGKRTVKHVHDLQSACLEVARKADDYAHRLGLRDRITEQLEELDWDSMTLKELADELDVMLGSSSAQLLKAQGAVDSLIERCKAFAEKRWAGAGMEQRFADFTQTLTEAFEEFDSTEGGNTKENLQQFHEALNQSVINAYLTMGGHPDYENEDTIAFLADQIDELFQNVIETLRTQTNTITDIPPEPPAANSETGIFIRLTEMLEDLKNPDRHGKELNDRIRAAAEDTVQLIDDCKDAEGMLVKIREACDEELAGILEKDADLRLSVDLFTKPLDDIDKQIRGTVNPQPLEYIPPKPVKSAQEPSQEVIPSQIHTTAASVPGIDYPAVTMESIKGRILDFTQGKITEGHTAYCQQLLDDTIAYISDHSASLDEQLNTLNQLITWLIAPMEEAHGSTGNHHQNLEENYQFPLFAHQEELANRKRLEQKPAQPHYKTVSGTPPQEPSISGQELHQAGLVHNQEEYDELCRIMGPQFMHWPGVKPRLQAFRYLQRFNPGFTNRHFKTLMSHMGEQNIELWMNSMNQLAQSGRYNNLLEHVEFAVRVAAKQRQVTPEVLEVLPYLNMNGLSGSNLLSQLSALTMLAQNLGNDCLTVQEMAIAINHNLLTNLNIQQISNAWQSPRELAQLNQSLIDETKRRRSITEQKRQDYQREGIFNALETRFNLAPYSIPANGDCMFSAVGHLMGEPMRKVRERCHWVAKDILDMKSGQFSLEKHTDYAGRITQAANAFDDKQLRGLAQRVSHKNLLTPVFEQTDQAAGWGTDDDLALVALAYNIPVVPVAPQNGLQDIFGFQPNGEMLWSTDTQGAAKDLTRATGQPPLMLICHKEHWEPLVARR